MQEGAQGVADLGVKVAGPAREQEEVAGKRARLQGDLAAVTRAQESATIKSQAVDLQDQTDRLLADREPLATGAGDGGAFHDIRQLDDSLNLEIAGPAGASRGA